MPEKHPSPRECVSEVPREKPPAAMSIDISGFPHPWQVSHFLEFTQHPVEKQGCFSSSSSNPSHFTARLLPCRIQKGESEGCCLHLTPMAGPAGFLQSSSQCPALRKQPQVRNTQCLCGTRMCHGAEKQTDSNTGTSFLQ